jgi:CDP-diacylglycerol--glycerol-3-phosphate 3-phosphatidyltransferase
MAHQGHVADLLGPVSGVERGRRNSGGGLLHRHRSALQVVNRRKLLFPAFDTQGPTRDKRSAQIRRRRPLSWERQSLGPTRNGPDNSVFNVQIRSFFTRLLTPIGNRLARMGVTPNAITVVGTLGAIAGALVLFTRGWWFAGALVIWAFVMLDALDGIVARASGRTSRFGAVLDSTCDRFADAAVFGSIGWYYALHGQRWMLLAALLCLVLGAVTSYIRARAEGAGFTCSVGIAERTDRLIVVLVGTGFTGPPFHVPYVQAIALWLLVAGSTITIGQRFATVYQQAAAAERA